MYTRTTTTFIRRSISARHYKLQARAITAFGDAVRRAGGSEAPAIRSLPERVDLADLPSTDAQGRAVVGLSSTTLRPVGPDGRRAVTEGPFVEAVEQLGGFYLVEVGDLDTMIDLAALLPDYYELEIRPVTDQ